MWVYQHMGEKYFGGFLKNLSLLGKIKTDSKKVLFNYHLSQSPI